MTRQKTTLYTGIGQPFEAKLAVVNLDKPFYKGHFQVELVPDLMADAFLGKDVIDRKSIKVVTRPQSLKDRLEEDISAKLMDECGVWNPRIPQTI